MVERIAKAEVERASIEKRQAEEAYRHAASKIGAWGVVCSGVPSVCLRAAPAWLSGRAAPLVAPHPGAVCVLCCRR